MRNRYYDTARLYAPTNSQSFHSKDFISRNAQPTHALLPGQSTKSSAKDSNKDSNDGANQEQQVYVIDDSSNNITDDDEDSQIKYLYSLYKNQ